MNAESMKQHKIGFTHGVGYSAAILIQHGQNTLAINLLKDSEISLSDFEKYCHEIDWKEIQKVMVAQENQVVIERDENGLTRFYPEVI